MGRNDGKKKVEFQIDPDKYELLKQLAEAEDRSVASMVRRLLDERIEKHHGSDDETKDQAQ